MTRPVKENGKLVCKYDSNTEKRYQSKPCGSLVRNDIQQYCIPDQAE